MRDLFEAGEALLDHSAYQPRIAADCVLDFEARARPTETELARLVPDLPAAAQPDHRLGHGRSRRTPRGGRVPGRPQRTAPARAGRRPAAAAAYGITAPVHFISRGSDEDLAGGFAHAGRLAQTPYPVLHNAVRTLLEHAGGRDPDASSSLPLTIEWY